MRVKPIRLKLSVECYACLHKWSIGVDIKVGTSDQAAYECPKCGKLARPVRMDEVKT